MLLTDGQRVKLMNMHRYRRRAIRRRMQNGMSFTPAEAATKHVFDTVGWHEVVRRLRLARGMVGGIGDSIARGKVPDSQNAEFVAELRRLAGQISTEAKALGVLLSTTGAKPRSLAVRPANQTSGRAYGKMTKIKKTYALGQLRAALSFIAKCRRNAPHVESRGGAIMTFDERTIIEHEIRRICYRAGRLKKLSKMAQ